MHRYWTTDVTRRLWGKFYFNTDKWVFGIGLHWNRGVHAWEPNQVTFSILIGPIEMGFTWRT